MYKSNTLRFDVNIDKKDSENYEISVLDLIKRDTSRPQNGESNEEIDKMLNIVKVMEAKYGPVAVVKGKRIRVNDFVDQGNGYDADDPFIDDSGEDEALVVAPDLMTEHGGFFINNESLKLNEGNFVIERVEGGNDLMNSSKQPFPHKNINKKSKSQKLLSQARKRLTISSKSSSSIRRTESSTDSKLEEIINDVVSTTSIPESEKVESSAPKIAKKIEHGTAQVSNVTQDKDVNVAQSNHNVTIVPQIKILELPTGLPNGVLEKIKLLREISESCKHDGKKIEPSFDTILLELDTMLHINQKGMKSKRGHTLRYVSQITNIKYDAILRRLLKIKDSKKQQKMKPLFTALEDAIKEAMPESISKYERAMTQYSIKIEAQKSFQAMPADEALSSSVDQSSDRDSEPKTKTTNKIKSPNRYFKWTVVCKTLLFKLVSGELEAFQISNNKSAPDEYLNKFFQTSVINLFPSKWMTASQLMKVSFPLLTEFKQCILDGKEFRSFTPVVKQKHEQKPPNHQNGQMVPQLKEPVLSLTKCSTPVDVNDCKPKPSVCQPKKPLPQLKPPPVPHINIDNAKSQPLCNPVNKVPKPGNPPIYLKPKQVVHSSSIVSPNRFPNTSPSESVKRYSDGSSVHSPSSVMPNRMSDCHGFNLIGLPSMNSHSDPSLSYLHNHLYSPNNQIDNHCRGSKLISTSSANAHLPPCALPLQHQQQNNMGNEFMHSGSYNAIPDIISRVSNRTQKVPDLSTIFSSSIERRHGNHHSPIIISTQQTQTNHNNIHQNPKLHKQCFDIMSDYETLTGPYHHSLAPIIDLTEDSTTGSNHNPQLSPSMFINMNTAHSSNPRNFQN